MFLKYVNNITANIVLQLYSMSYTITKIPSLDIFPELIHYTQIPESLYVRGTVPLDGLRIAIIGSRNLTTYGKDTTWKLIEGLQHFPAVIVSGLAFGIDIEAHKAALHYKLPTIAIPGSGLSQKALYPASHITVAEEIIQHNGALISMFEPEQIGTTWTFPRRNRLIAALADMIIVVEAQHESGSLITAQFGLEFGKKIGAVPGNVNSSNSFGTNNLLKQGATVICDAVDIARECNWTIPTLNINQESLLLNSDEEKIIKTLSEARSKSELARLTGIDIASVGVTISRLELKGYVAEEMGLVRKII